MNYSVITFIFNNYEPIREVSNPQDNVEYVLVTDDKNLVSNTWKVIYEPLLDTDKISGIAKTFLIKYNAWKYVSNDIYFRIDSQLEIINSLDELVEEFERNHYDVLTFQHAYNYDVFKEYSDWECWRTHNVEFRNKFFKNMEPFGYDYSWKGLFGTTLSICRNTEWVNELMNDMVHFLFSDNYQTVDNNDQCYWTVLLMTKYNNRINTEVKSWTIIHSQYFIQYVHGKNGKQNICIDCEHQRGIEKIKYWRGENKGVLSEYGEYKY